jgi:pre-mRNA-processing factor SLU7
LLAAPLTLTRRMLHITLRAAQVKAALKKLDRQEREAMEKEGTKNKFNSLAGGEDVTPEEMEAWRMKRARGEDPVAAAAGTKGYDLL